MAATETFASVLNSLSPVDKEKLRFYIKEQQSEMFAARSEEARVRIAHGFIHEVRHRLKK